jgi:hypothetical protein
LPLIASERPGTAAAGDDAADADPFCPGAAVLVVDEPAVGVPDEHAATVRLAAQAARASAIGRCLFIDFPRSVQKFQVPP